MQAIKTENLTKRYKDLVAVDGINITVEEGELFALLGVNGAGKTTTIKMLSTLTIPDDGNAWLEGHSIRNEASAVKDVIGVSPQETAIAPHLTVYENLEFMAGIYGLDKAKTSEKIDELSETFGLTPILKKKAGKLSGGWKRKLSIALALISEPHILFLDEPTLGLDVLARHELWAKIKELKGKITIVLTTHYMDEAEKLSDRVAIMKDGKVIAIGTLDELYEMSGKTTLEDAFIEIVTGGAL